MELYRGVVSHRRSGPGPSHGFAYELFLALIDVDAAPQSLSGLWPFSALNSLALASFHEADHMKGGLRRDGESLGSAIRRLVAERVPNWVPPRDCKILLLTHLRTFGYCFNPISIYYIIDKAGIVDCIVAEVSNTPWNEMHLYVLHRDAPGVVASREPRDGERRLGASTGTTTAEPPLPLSDSARTRLRSMGATSPLDFDALSSRFSEVNAGASGASGFTQSPRNRRQRSPSPSPRSTPLTLRTIHATAAAVSAANATDILRFRWAKDFHVSPFFGMDHEYDWRFSQPGDGTLLVQSRNLHDGKCVFSTQLMLEGAPATRARLAFFLFIAFPLLTLRIQFLIHYEALRLFRKGVGLFPHPTGGTKNAFIIIMETIAAPIIAVLAIIQTMRRVKPW
jgi:DUF1365 family protein